MNLQTLQREVGEWSRRNFPGNQPHHPLLGVAEELFLELNIADNVAEHIDALCDAIIFLCDYCERSGLSMPHTPVITAKRCDFLVGVLCRAELKSSQGIRGSDALWRRLKQDGVNQLVGTIYGEGCCVSDNFGAVLAATWAEVSKRDWRANPETGVVS